MVETAGTSTTTTSASGSDTATGAGVATAVAIGVKAGPVGWVALAVAAAAYGIHNLFKGGTSRNAYQDWWNDLGASQTQVNDLIGKIFQEQTGQPPSEMTAGIHKDYVVNLFNAAKLGQLDTEQGTINAIRHFTKNYEGTKPAVNKFNDALSAYKNSVDKILGDFYDSDYWTPERIETEFRDNYTAQGADTQFARDNTSAVIQRDWKKKTDAGIYDETTGKKLLTDVDTSAPDFDIDTFVADKETELGVTGNEGLDKLFSDAGFSKEDNKPLYDHLSEIITSGDGDLYDAKILLQADPDFIKNQYEKDKAEFFPTLDESTQREIEFIDEEGERLKGVAERQFKEFAPEVAMTAKQFGGATREDTFISDTLAKYRADLEVNREDYLSGLRLESKFAGEARRTAFEAGDFQKLQQLTGGAAIQGLQTAAEISAASLKARNLAAANRLDKSAMLANRSYERFIRESEKESKRAFRIQQDAATRANKRARKLGAFVDYATAAAGIVAAPFTGGASLALTLSSALSAYGRQQNIQTPQLDLSAVGAYTSAFYPSSLENTTISDRYRNLTRNTGGR